ncbi:hypothetical protein R3P38DRAFT_3479443 [Favolaschia claudopus]|uniref:Uncharacterized protein n=1 Tax=Favolaschia claudopus TaxID=2862362 RepID=A0AAV9Z9I2_9AGAR
MAPKTPLKSAVDARNQTSHVHTLGPMSISTLEAQLAESEALVRHLRMKLAYRNAAFKSPLNRTTVSPPSSAATSAPSNSHPPSGDAAASLYIMRASLRAVTTPPPLQEEDSESTLEQKIQLGYEHCINPFAGESEESEPKQRWIGKSSSASLVKAAVTFKAETFKQELEYQPSNDAHGPGAALKTSPRAHHWQQRPSPPFPSLTTAFDFPPRALIFDLIDLYFTQVNIYIPLLHRPTFEREIYLDGQMSCSLGRTCGTDYFDLDIEPPLEVDDEFWEDPVHPFKRPHGFPSTVTFFSVLQLNHILSPNHLFINSVGEESLLVDLDSSLNDYLNRSPEHLRWDPARENQLFLCELQHVQKCMQLVKSCEERWQLAGLLWDILAELMSVGHLPPPTQTNSGSSWPDIQTANWANAPVGLDADVWGTYLNSFHETPQE